MDIQPKAINSEDQNQKLNCSSNEEIPVVPNLKLDYKSPYQKKPSKSEMNYCILILICLLIASSAIFTYRYFQMPQKSEGIFINGMTETNTLIQNKNQIENFEQEAHNEKEMVRIQTEKSPQNQITSSQLTQNQLKNPLISGQSNAPLKKQQSNINENSQQFQKSQKSQKSQKQYLKQIQNELKIHDIEIQKLHQQDTQSDDEQNLQEQSLLKGKSIEQRQFLAQKAISTKNSPKDSEQRQNHQEDQQEGYDQQEEVQEDDQIDQQLFNQMNEIKKPKIKKSQNIKVLKLPNRNKFIVISPNNQRFPRKQVFGGNYDKESEYQLAKQAKPSKQGGQTTNQNSENNKQTKQSLTVEDGQLFDPILKVKKQMEQKFNQKFEDLVYIKPGTNITQTQYNNAKDRMNLWKYFNVRTKKLQILDEVNYEPEILADQKSREMSIQKMEKMYSDQEKEYEDKYQIGQYNQIPFCIIIPSYKNADKYFRNLNSILQQDYSNFHVIYIDDASKDGTAENVRNYIKKYQIPQSKLLFIQNQQNKKALPNIDYAARKLCKSGQIMAIIDGDDYLIGSQVFKVVNARYQSQNLLALYTNHLRVHQPIYLKVGTCIDYPSRVKKMRSFRHYSIFPASHLRTFFVDLYWRISMRDLRDHKGQYFTAANDFAIMMPILEMASDRFQYLPELTYVYDAGTGYNNFQTKTDVQAKNFKTTKRRHRYPKINHILEFQKRMKQNIIDKPNSQERL